MHTALTVLIACSPLIVALPSSDQSSDSPQTETSTAVHPLSDPTKLKYEVAGIVGAYLFWLIGTVILVIFVGNRLRRRNRDHNTTMLKTFHTTERIVEVPLVFDSPSLKSLKSPKSPGKLSGIKSWGRKHKSTGSTYSTSTLNSVQHEQHKAKDMDDLTKLYAAVMAHDEERSQGQSSTVQSPTSPTDRSMKSPGYPPEFAHLHNLPANVYYAQGSGSNQALHHPMAPTPIDDSFPEESNDYNDPDIPSRTSSRTMKGTPLSFISDGSSRAGSVISSRSRPSRISVRGQHISQPIGSADLRDAHLYEETIPLSLRIYSPGPPPPTPGKKKKQVQISIEAVADDVLPPQQQYQAYQPHQQDQSHQQHYQVYQHQAYTQQQHLQQHPLPQQYQQEQYSVPPPQQQYQPPTLAQTINNKRVPQSLALRSAALANSTSASSEISLASTSKPLPFRDMYTEASMRSAPATKTTFLDRPTKLPTGPKTGIMPSTPYSPYTPMTPMTPITPRRLMNKQELKAQRKEAKLRVLHEDDLVQGDNDMWGK